MKYPDEYEIKSNIEPIVIENSDIFSQRESGITHTPYETERMFFTCIKNGDCEKLEEMFRLIISENIIAGKMSDDELRQIKYWAVCCITLATRYAISGGLDETTAYNFSDKSIMSVDAMNRKDEILEFLKNKCFELTRLVSRSAQNLGYPSAVRRCIHYINTNLHEKLTNELLAEECSVSSDYLSALFKKSTGRTISSFIKEKRLEAAKDMLLAGKTTSEAAYYLGFCSESYFIKCFREYFGITPKKYVVSYGNLKNK